MKKSNNLVIKKLYNLKVWLNIIQLENKELHFKFYFFFKIDSEYSTVREQWKVTGLGWN